MARKRSNGDGSVYPRKDGRWVATVPYKDALGVMQHATEYRRSKAEADRVYQEMLADRERGQLGQTEYKTVEQFVAAWLKTSIKPNVKPTTYANYSRTMSVYVLPHIGPLELKKLTFAQVQALFNKLTAGGLGPGGARQVLRVLSVAFNEAIRWGLIERNPAKGVRLPALPKSSPTVLSLNDAQAFLRAIKGHRLEALFAVALALGLRSGEALGLRWQDVDFDKNLVYIRKTLQKVDGEFVLLKPKTDSSESPLHLPKSLRAKLRAHRVRQLEERALLGPKWHDWQGEGLVFTNPDGEPVRPQTLSNQYKALLKKAGLPDMTLHELRKSCATLLHAQGVADKEIQMVMRHSSIEITRNIYVQGVPSLQRTALDDLSELLFGKEGS